MNDLQCDQCGFQFTSSEQTPSCPKCGSPTVFSSKQEAVDRAGCPWEGRTSVLDLTSLFETVKGVLLEPSQTFRNTEPRGDLGSPAIFMLILVMFSTVISLVMGLGLQLMINRHQIDMMLQAVGESGLPAMAPSLIVVMGILVFLIGLPIMFMINWLAGSGVVHLCLMVLGAANNGFEATARTMGYCYGATSLLGLVPLCGGFISPVWFLVSLVIGLREMHETSTEKAVAAVMLPFLLCCACGLAILFLGLSAVVMPFLEQMTGI